MPANRLSWVTSSPQDGADTARTQETVDLGTADESVRRWRLGRSVDAVDDDAPQGPVSPDGYQRLGVGTSGFFEGGLVMGDATGVQPLSGSVRFSDPVQGPDWELVPTRFVSTAWHPSGQQVYAEAVPPGDAGGYLEPTIVRFDIDGTNYTPLIDFPDNGDSHFGQRDPDVDADDEHLTFVTQVDPEGEPTGQTLELYGWSFRPQALYMADTDGTDPAPLVTGDHWLRIEHPAIAPDGSAVVFVGLTDTFAYGHI
jgi:hypothetical protein